jgi:hypothetical protein
MDKINKEETDSYAKYKATIQKDLDEKKEDLDENLDGEKNQN